MQISPGTDWRHTAAAENGLTLIVARVTHHRTENSKPAVKVAQTAGHQHAVLTPRDTQLDKRSTEEKKSRNIFINLFNLQEHRVWKSRKYLSVGWDDANCFQFKLTISWIGGCHYWSRLLCNHIFQNRRTIVSTKTCKKRESILDMLQLSLNNQGIKKKKRF